MQVKDVGEFHLIEVLAETIKAKGTPSTKSVRDLGYRLRTSIGDDAAAWEGPAGATVFTADAMVEGVHFDLGKIGWADLGWKALAVNLSDIAAMGCAPLYATITLGLRGDLPVEGLRTMYRGMLEACDEYGGTVVGGDTVSSPVFFVAVSMVGAAAATESGITGPAPLLRRNSALPGDGVAVTGSLGCSAGALMMMRQGPSVDAETSAHLMAAHNRPAPRVAEGLLMARHGVGAAIDVSDGLVDDLGKLCKTSGVGALLHSGQVPADEHLRKAYPEDWLSLALSGGEDYELLFTASPRIIEEVSAHLDVPVTVIGEIVSDPEGVAVLDRTGRTIEVDRGGWDHFAQR